MPPSARYHIHLSSRDPQWIEKLWAAFCLSAMSLEMNNGDLIANGREAAKLLECDAQDRFQHYLTEDPVGRKALDSALTKIGQETDRLRSATKGETPYLFT